MCLTVNGKDIIDWSENLKLHLGVTIDGDVILILVCMLVMCVWKLARELEWSWGWGILHQLWPNYTSLPRLTCCQLVWHFCRASDTCRLERVQEWGLRAAFTDKFSSYQQLLENANAGADPGEVKRVNFHPPFSESPSFFFFLIPQILIGSNTLLQIRACHSHQLNMFN